MKPAPAIDGPQTPQTTLPDAELREASRRFPDGTMAVDGVSLAVARGEFFSILGPSGCGKSTLLRMIAGLDQPTSGSIAIRGDDMRGCPAHRRPTNMVFQGLGLFPHMTVSQNVAYGPRIRREPRAERSARVEDMLALVELTGYGERYPHELSGGQRQRVAIARALANRPAVLLLDEPLGALDLKLRNQLQQSLKQIQQQSGTTFIYVTHDQAEAMTMSDRVAVMNAGRIEQVDVPDGLYNRPLTRFVASFVGDTNLFSGTVASRRLDAGDVSVALPRAGTVACVRPERVLVGGALDDAVDNVYSGTVVDVAFKGPTVSYRVRLDGGRTLLAERPADGGQPALAPGQMAQIGFDVDAVWVLDESAPAEEES